jgi:hypothetical protein
MGDGHIVSSSVQFGERRDSLASHKIIVHENRIHAIEDFLRGVVMAIMAARIMIDRLDGMKKGTLIADEAKGAPQIHLEIFETAHEINTVDIVLINKVTDLRQEDMNVFPIGHGIPHGQIVLEGDVMVCDDLHKIIGGDDAIIRIPDKTKLFVGLPFFWIHPGALILDRAVQEGLIDAHFPRPDR